MTRCRVKLIPLPSRESPTRRSFLRSCVRALVPLTLVGINIAGGYVLFRRGYQRVLTAGVADRRFTVEASLPILPAAPIPFEHLEDGETLLGKRIRLLTREQDTIDIESGFVSTPAGRDLRLRVSPTHTFRSTDQFRGVLVSTSILDVIREARQHVRFSSLHGAAILSAQDCAHVAKLLAASAEREVTAHEVPYELRSPFSRHGAIDLSFERTSPL